MLNKLASIGNSAGFWLALIFIGLSFEAVALYYQHVLEELPCVLCIQVRLWVLALMVISLAALMLRRVKGVTLVAQLLITLVFAGLLERSYQLLGAERGFTFGDCGYDLGLPAWFAIDTWLPAIFEVQTSCGYTPELLFGITMAEALIVMSFVFLLAGASLTIISLLNNRATHTL